MELNDEIYIAFDPKALIILSNIHARNIGSPVYVDYSSSVIRDQLGYYKNILGLIYAGEIKPVVLERVYEEALSGINVKTFINEYGYFTVPETTEFKIKGYEIERNKLANAYCQPFEYKNRGYKGPFEYIRREGESKLVPEMKAYVVADAVINNCQLVVADEIEYISKVDESIRNERALGIMQINFDNKYGKYVQDNSFLSFLGLKRETIKPISIKKFGAMIRRGVENFYATTPKAVSRTNRYVKKAPIM